MDVKKTMKQTRTYYAKLNITLGFVSKLVTIIAEFILRSIFIQYLGEELLGVNGVFTNVIQILSLTELGLNHVVGYSFYKPLANNDEGKISALIRFYKRIYNIISLVVLVIGILLIPFLKFIINTDFPVDNLYVLYIIFLADTVFSYFFVYKNTLLTAAQKGYISTKYNMFAELLIIMVQIVIIVLYKNLVLYLLARVVINLTKNYLLSKRAERDYPYIKKESSDLSQKEISEMKETIKSGFIYKLSSVLLNSTDSIIISSVIGTVWVGYLANYNTITIGLDSFYTIIFSSLTAGVGNLVEREGVEQREKIFNIMLMTAAWISVVFSGCFYALSDEFVTLWLGEKYALDNFTVISKTLILFLSCSMQPIFTYREALGLYRKTKYAMLAAAFINVILSIFLGIWLSLGGVLIATVISRLLTYYWYEPNILYRECFQKKANSYFKRRIVDWIGLIIVLYAVRWVGIIWNAVTWMEWVIKAVSIFVAVNVVCWFIYGKTNEFYALKKQINNIVTKKF